MNSLHTMEKHVYGINAFHNFKFNVSTYIGPIYFYIRKYWPRETVTSRKLFLSHLPILFHFVVYQLHSKYKVMILY